MKSRKVMGLSISPSKSNAIKFAHDLMQLQAEMYHLTNIVNFLDHDADRGHINYELNKFGLAIAAAVKEDLRENPDKKQIKFYLQVLEACWENRNYEIGARIKQGIVDAMLIDIIEPAPGADRFSIPEEDPKIKSARDALNKKSRN